MLSQTKLEMLRSKPLALRKRILFICMIATALIILGFWVLTIRLERKEPMFGMGGVGGFFKNVYSSLLRPSLQQNP